MTTEVVLSQLTRATRMLAEVRTATDAKSVRDLAATMEYWAKARKMGEESIGHARCIKFDAERMLGEFLRSAEKAKGGQPYQHPSTPDQTLGVEKPPSLADIGVTYRESADSQLLATIAEEAPEEFNAIKEGKTTIATVRRDRKRAAVKEANEALIATASPIASITPGETYQTIVLDPPWDWGDEGDADQMGRARPTYGTMPIEEIAALPISDLASKNAHLYLWITNRSLPKGFDLLEGWGFRYVTMLTWVKPTFGMGNYFRGSTEHVLFGVRGSCPLLRNDVGTHFLAERSREHSAKPPEFYALVETCSPGPWLEAFARKERPGWVTWGAEIAAHAVL